MRGVSSEFFVIIISCRKANYLNIGMDDKNKEVTGIKKVISLFVKKCRH